MSGGCLGYFYGQLEEHVGDFADRELDELVQDLVTLFHEREWYLSGDTSKGAWNDARDKFKRKWFGEGARQERIEKYLDDIKQELLQSLGLSMAYCRNCEHWRSLEEDDFHYGECDINDGCLMHRSETCECFEKKGVRE